MKVFVQLKVPETRVLDFVEYLDPLNIDYVRSRENSDTGGLTVDAFINSESVADASKLLREEGILLVSY